MKNEISIAEFRRMMTDVLSAIDSWCISQGRHYSLAGGTLIGAVRHKGFIPWDDDVDIWMPRPDYDYFISNFSHSYFEVISAYNSKDYPLEYAKVQDTRTFVTEGGKDFPWGVFVDVFPLDGLPSYSRREAYLRKVALSKHLLANQRFTYKFRYSKSAGLKKNLSILIGRLVHPFISFNWIVRNLDKTMKMYDYESSPLVLSAASVLGIAVPKKYIESFVDLEFEGRKFKATAYYDEWLRLDFGDYMVLPPVEDRKSKHEIKAYWKA